MKKLKKKKIIYYKNKRILMYSILGLFLFIGMGYSVLNTSLNVLGDITVKRNVETTLYNVLKREAESNGLAREYTGNHQDSMNLAKSNKNIYHWYAENSDDQEDILNKNNVIFANHCWQMIRTTDTGGVKLLYNGEEENGKCLNTRGNHVGYDSDTPLTLNSNYWYGTDYTYDSVNNLFSISGDTVSAVWSESTSSDLIGKYTCMAPNENDSCQYLFLIESYLDTERASTIVISSNSHYSQFGTLRFDGSSSNSSLARVGYMYGDAYQRGTTSNESSISFNMPTERIVSDIMSFTNTYLYSKTVSFDGTNYTLDNPVSGSSISSKNDYYTFGSSSVTSGTNPYYLVGVSYKTNYYYLQLSPTDQLSSHYFMVGDSISDNGDGSYTINGTSTVTPVQWFTNYASLKNKYTCGSNTATCDNPRYILSSSKDSYSYFYATDKILIAKSRNGVNLNDTLTVTYDDWYSNYQSYSDYKYTCGTDSATCTEANLKMIISYNNTGYKYADNYYYGSSVEWDGTKYTLVNPIGIEDHADFEKLATHHYICEGVGLKTCEKVAYVYYYHDGYGSMNYIILQDGVTNITKALEDMLEKNETNSLIKSGVDAWYKKYMLSYDDYIEDTIFCDDRSVRDYGGWDANSGIINQAYISFKNDDYNNSDLSCTKPTDQFSISNPRAKLTYKVGLLSFPETYIGFVSAAGGYYKCYGLLSPKVVDANMNVTRLGKYGYGGVDAIDIYTVPGVRPVISLAPKTEYLDGDGSMERPFYVGQVYTITNNNQLFEVKAKAAPNYQVSITSDNYEVTSFKVNGTLVEGNTFIMPAENVEITDIQYVDAYYSITNTDLTVTVPSMGRYRSNVTLEAEEGYLVTSFKVNGTLVEGNSFIMPAENVTITEITKIVQVVVESEHNPYPDNLDNAIYYENTFAGATSLTVELTYQTEAYWSDWIWLYDDENSSTPVNNNKYSGSTKQTETITINSNYLKITLTTDSIANNYYGFKAVITPNYD